MSEGAVVNACLRWLLLNQYHAWRNNTGKYPKTYTNKRGVTKKYMVSYGAKGSPDIIAIQPATGKFVGIECKVKGKKPEPAQKAFGEEITKRGGIYIVAYSPDDLEREL